MKTVPYFVFLFPACLFLNSFSQEKPTDSLTDTGVSVHKKEAPTSGSSGVTQKKYFCEIVWSNDAFSYSSTPFTAVYNDGIDDYPIAIPRLSMTRNSQFGLTVGWNLLRMRKMADALAIGFRFITGNELSGIQFQLAGKHSIELLRRLRAHADAGASYNSANLEVGTVGTGSRTGADFMKGPNGEYIPRGSSIFMHTGFLAVQGGIGIQYFLTGKMYIDASATYVFYCNSSTWFLMTSTKAADIELPAEKFVDLSRLGSIENTGPGVRLCMGFCY